MDTMTGGLLTIVFGLIVGGAALIGGPILLFRWLHNRKVKIANRENPKLAKEAVNFTAYQFLKGKDDPNAIQRVNEVFDQRNEYLHARLNHIDVGTIFNTEVSRSLSLLDILDCEILRAYWIFFIQGYITDHDFMMNVFTILNGNSQAKIETHEYTLYLIPEKIKEIEAMTTDGKTLWFLSEVGYSYASAHANAMKKIEQVKREHDDDQVVIDVYNRIHQKTSVDNENQRAVV